MIIEQIILNKILIVNLNIYVKNLFILFDKYSLFLDICRSKTFHFSVSHKLSLALYPFNFSSLFRIKESNNAPSSDSNNLHLTNVMASNFTKDLISALEENDMEKIEGLITNR